MDTDMMFGSEEDKKSDPFVIIKCGDVTIGNRDEYVLNR
jgi:hypothetical protein